MSQLAYSKVSVLTKRDLRITVSVLAKKKKKKKENVIFNKTVEDQLAAAKNGDSIEINTSCFLNLLKQCMR